MSYFGVFVMLVIFFCLGIMSGLLLAFHGILEIVSGLVDFLIERRDYILSDESYSAEE